MHALDEPSSFGISGGNVGRLELPPVHRLDRAPFPWLPVWIAIAAACWLLVAVRVW